MEQIRAMLANVRSSYSSWQEAIDGLLRMRTLAAEGQDFDGEPPTTELIDASLNLATAMRDDNVTPPLVVAGANGSVYFEWRGDRYIELEVIEPFKAKIRKGAREVSFTWTPR